jgi:3-hydroxyisobutyrate dehydrogenase
MALNLFTKTYLAHSQSASKENPEFLICENDDRRAQAFIEDLKQKGGSELANRVNRVGSGREYVHSPSSHVVY